MNKVTGFIRKLKSLRKFLRDGGHTQVSIAQITSGEVLQGKKILITGGGSGIGLSIAKKCLSEGASVLITGRNEKKLQNVVKEIKSDCLKILVWDISEVHLVTDRVNVAQELLGGEIDILVNNAGILSSEIFPNVTEETWDKAYSTNSKGLFFLTQKVCDRWINNKSSNKKILNISSAGGFVGATYPYRMTKWDINGLTLGLGRRLASKGIIVNGIAPGRIATDMQSCSNPADNVFDPQSFMERYGLPEEVSELALFLMSDASNFITGQTILCDGGGYKTNT